jgi:formylglycine-generating enzyme required for sulfatase activity
VELVLVPGGRFLMGSPEGEEGRFDREGPQHEVELASFWLARTPVTNAQYQEYMKANRGAKGPEYWGDHRFNQDQQPVVGVSWHEAKAYCAWAELRLPTEAQWEYACRAGTTTRYCSGDTEEDLTRVGWYVVNSGGRLHAVRELEPNAWGLYDMHGNTFEWCEDRSGSYETNPCTRDGLRYKPVGGADRVVRGGHFGDEDCYTRSAYRNGDEPFSRHFYVGFRPAQSHP